MEWFLLIGWIATLVWCFKLFNANTDLDFENRHMRKIYRRVELLWGHAGSDHPIITDACQWIGGGPEMDVERFVEHLNRTYGARRES